MKEHEKLSLFTFLRNAMKLIKVPTAKTVAKESQMKKFAFIALFALVAFGVAFATTTGTIGLSGSVSPSFDLTLPSSFTNGTMNDDGSDNNWAIGNIVVKSNYSSWTIAIASANSGNLKNGNDTVPYTVTLGSLATNQSLGSQWTSAGQPKTARAGNTYALSVKFKNTSSDFWQAGAYSDTLTVTIGHN